MTPQAQLNHFIDKYDPAIARLARATLQALRRQVPGASELVYDNYNALAIGFGPSDRTSDAVFSIAVFPRWVSLFFLKGAGLRDPHGLLKGSGSRARHVVLGSSRDIEKPALAALIQAALREAQPSIDPGGRRRLLIKSISARQRPRRPVAAQGRAAAGRKVAASSRRGRHKASGQRGD